MQKKSKIGLSFLRSINTKNNLNVIKNIFKLQNEHSHKANTRVNVTSSEAACVRYVEIKTWGKSNAGFTRY